MSTIFLNIAQVFPENDSLLTSQRYILPPGLNPRYSFKNTHDCYHIRLHILCGMEHLPDTDGFVPAVYNCHYNGYPCVFGNMIKTTLPLCDLVTCPLGRDGQDEFF